MNKHPVVNILLRSVSKGAVATSLLVAALILSAPSQVLAQTAPSPASGTEAYPTITIVRPASGMAYQGRVLLDGSNGTMLSASDGTSINRVTVVIHHTSGGSGDGYVGGSGAFVSNRYEFTALLDAHTNPQTWSIAFHHTLIVSG